MIVYDSNGQPYEADLVLGEQYRELEKENKRLENIFASGIHSCHENCQRPLCVLRRRAEKAEARVKELEFGLKHQCETCEMKSIFDGEHAYALKMQARVKELETLLASEKATRNAVIAKGIAMERANAEAKLLIEKRVRDEVGRIACLIVNDLSFEKFGRDMRITVRFSDGTKEAPHA